MDCVDCHNRPTHAFDLPENAVDKQMANGHISPELPYIQKKAVEVLKVNYPAREIARRSIKEELNNFYRHELPADLQDAAHAGGAGGRGSGEHLPAQHLPGHATDMGRHPNNLGHNDSPGCFRCHDGSHTSADGQTITNDCSAMPSDFWQRGKKIPRSYGLGNELMQGSGTLPKAGALDKSDSPVAASTIYAVIRDSKARRLGITRVEPVCWMALLLESGEKPADGLARGADHLADLFVSQSQLHLAGVSGLRCSGRAIPSGDGRAFHWPSRKGSGRGFRGRWRRNPALMCWVTQRARSP